MSPRVGDDKIAEVRERTSLVEIVSRYTALKRTGRNHQGLCPFHAEKTPSFSVSEDGGVFYCFGCQAGGDVFKFVMLKENLTFPEALERLAREAGVELPKRPTDERREQGRERLLRVNVFAAKFFQRALWEGSDGAAARQYLVTRHIREETARAFGLGYAPADGLAAALERASAPLADAEALGLIGRSTRGGWYDRFRSRLMFPITDLSGKTIAFGGRTLGDDKPKYLNSPESPVFHKGRSVFGLGAARDAIHERSRVILVEGYIDVIALAQAGIGNVVAPLGTSLTADQIRLLKRFTDNFLVLFDGDRAGIAAAARAFALFAEVGIFAEAAFLPAGHDPDTFVNAAGAPAMEDVFARRSPLVDHYLRSLAPADASLAARARAAETVAELCQRLESSIFAGLFRRRAAEHLGLPEEQLASRSAKRSSPAPKPEAASAPAPSATLSSHESMILELLLVHPELQSKLPPGVEVLFASPGSRALFERIREDAAHASSADLVGSLPREAADRVGRAWLGEREVYAAPEQMLEDCLARLDERSHDARLRALTQQIRDAESRGDAEGLEALLTEKQRLAATRSRPQPGSS
ncbi:MAG TPA: DNA primase [Candidatus Binatia bacterium]|nr:DNA primase [Candidatus Binatia bacterium]